VIAVAFYGGSGDAYRGRDFFADFSGCQELNDLEFARGEREGSDREDWKAAEDDLFARISVDFEESGGNLYALASLPGCAGTHLTVAEDECWLLICGYTERERQMHMAGDFGEGEDGDADSCCDCADDFHAISSDESCEVRDRDAQPRNAEVLKNENDLGHDHEHRIAGLRAPRPFCAVAPRAKIEPGRSVAVLSNGLLAIRMCKAGMETPVPRVA
jgi:HSP20 family molecular chaperone IbpA